MSESSPPIAQLSGATVFYGDVVGLSRVDLTIGAGITGVVGPNGSGKSTMMRLLTGAVAPSEGQVTAFGRDPFTDPDARRRIALVPAHDCFWPRLSGRKNLELAFIGKGLEPAAAKKAAAEGLAIADLEEAADRDYATWSRGMRQRLKLGLALASDAALMLLDEPYLGVDPTSRRRIRQLVQRMANEGRAVVISSHVLSEVETLTDTVAILLRGRLLGHGALEDLAAALRRTHPVRIRLRGEGARALAPKIVEWPHVQSVQLEGDLAIELSTTDPESTYGALTALVAEAGVPVHELESPEASLDAIFSSLTEAGARQLDLGN